MAGRIENLRSFNTMTQEERKNLGRRGGIASGAARREKRERIAQAEIEEAAKHKMISDSISLVSGMSRELVSLLHNLRGY